MWEMRFYGIIALLVHVILFRFNWWLVACVGVFISGLSVGVLALLSTHEFDFFFTGRNLSELFAGNIAAAVIALALRPLLNALFKRVRPSRGR